MSALDLTAVRADLANCAVSDGSAAVAIADTLLAEVEQLRQVNERLVQHARDEHAQGWSEAIGYLQGLAAGADDDKETVALWRAAEKLQAFAKELREAEVEA